MDDITARLGLDTTAFARGLRGAGRMADTASASIARSFSKIGGMVAGALGINALFGFGKSAVDYASRLNDVSENLGVTTDFLQDFSFIMSQAGVSTEQSSKALEKFTRTLGDARQGEESAIKIFAKYGMALTMADGTLKTTEQLFLEVSDRIKATTDATAKSTSDALR